MKFIFMFLLVLFIPVALQAQFPGKPMLFNAGWNFHLGDLSQSTGDNATGWRSVDLPHDWSIEGPFSEEWASATGYLPGGIGWYKKSFVANPAWRQKQVYIYFDGVYKNSEVRINGHLLGKRPNGFIAFQYDMSPYLNYSGTNVITVKVDHSEFADSRWYTGSGIYRNVYLIVKNPVHLGVWDVAFATPSVSRQQAQIRVQANITNNTKRPAAVTLQMQLKDKAGKVVLTAKQPLSVRPGVHTAELNGVLQSPDLWSDGSPDLYQLNVALIEKGTLTDAVVQQVGIRSIRFDKEQGFFLNGKNMKLKGVCIHDDAGALGVAVPTEVWERRLRILKEAGVNSLRLSHNPHADYLYDLCDRMGFLVMDEAFDEWELGKNKWVQGWNVGTPSKNGYHEYFKEWANRDLGDQVQRDRNHPSIVMWSIGNEIDYPNDPYSHEILNTGRNPQIYGKGYLPDHPPASQMTPIARQLVSVVKQYDTSRPVTAALAGVVMSNEVGYPEALDVVGYNYQEYRYAEDHARYPNRIIYGSENGMAKSAWNAVDSNSYVSAQYLWTGIDYLGEAGKWPQRSNGAGLIDLAGFKKTEYYYRQSLWAQQPMVYIAVAPARQQQGRGIWSHREAEPVWNWSDTSQVRVECFTNCQEAELFLNGISLGRKQLSQAANRAIFWLLAYKPGRLEVKGYNNGTAVCNYALHTAGKPSQLTASTGQETLNTTPAGLNQIEVNIADNQGNLVYQAEHEVQVTVTGPAKLIGLESGSSVSHENYKANKRQVRHGRLLAYVKNTGKPGAVKVTFSASGLTSKSINYQVR